MGTNNSRFDLIIVNFYIIIFLLMNQIIYSQKVITKKHWGTNITKEEYQVDAQGQRNGFYKSYNPDGILLFSYNYKNGKEHGNCIDYAGQREGREIYCYGKALSERVMEDGKIISEKYYSCDNNSNYLVYSKKLISPNLYENITYHKNGKLNEKFNENSFFQKEKGMYERFYENGRLAEKGMIDNGKFGKWIGFYENGDTMYISTSIAGFECYFKKFYAENKIEYVQYMDDNFENISKIEYYQNGNLKSEKLSKTFPFKFECTSKVMPKNWRELAEQRILCAGQSYSPFENSYIVSEKKYNENGELISEIKNVLRIVNGKNKVFNKSEIEAEDLLWEAIQKDNSYANLGNYYNNATLNFYSIEVNKIFYFNNDKYQKEIDKCKDEFSNLESESRNKKESGDTYMKIAETEKSKKIYPKFEIANTTLEDQINSESKKLSDLNFNIETMENQISEGGSIDLSKNNKKELSGLINIKLDIIRKVYDLTLLRNKLWEKYIAALRNKELMKNFNKIVTTEELLEIVKQ